MTLQNLLTTIATKAEERQLQFLGLVNINSDMDFRRYEDWLKQGAHADLHYLKRNKSLRKNASELMANATGALVFALPYYQGDTMLDFRGKKNPWLAQYSRFRDYHKSLRKACRDILDQSIQDHAFTFNYRICVDSAPVLERSFAERTGQGFIGKNTCFIHPKLGSYFLLAEVLVDIKVNEDDFATTIKQDLTRRDQVTGGCGSCKRCQVHCPTGALSTDYKLDARRCISYWTIEHRGTIPQCFWPHLVDYLFGCDICQLVCPYNRGAKTASDIAKARLKREYAPADILELNRETFLGEFAGTPVMRTGFSGMVRNALIAAYVQKQPKLEVWLQRFSSDENEVIRATCGQITPLISKKLFGVEYLDGGLDADDF